MSKLFFIFLLLINVHLFSQTHYYLRESNSPETLEDIVKILNIKNAKKISIYSQTNDLSVFIGEVLINPKGKCIQKSTNNYLHKYDEHGNLIEEITYTDESNFLPDSLVFRHYIYTYDESGNTIETIQKDRNGIIISRGLILTVSLDKTPNYRKPLIDNNREFEKKYSEGKLVREISDYENIKYKYYPSGALKSVVYVNKIHPNRRRLAPDLFSSIDTSATETIEYTYNRDGCIVRYYSSLYESRGGTVLKSEMGKIAEKITEYRYKYDDENKLIMFYKKIISDFTFGSCEVTVQFNYINENTVELTSNKSCGHENTTTKLLYKIEFY